MPKMLIALPDDLFQAITKKSKSLGLTRTAYIRKIINESSKNKQELTIHEVGFLFQCFASVLAKAFGITNRAPKEKIEKLSAILKEKFQKEVKGV